MATRDAPALTTDDEDSDLQALVDGTGPLAILARFDDASKTSAGSLFKAVSSISSSLK